MGAVHQQGPACKCGGGASGGSGGQPAQPSHAGEAMAPPVGLVQHDLACHPCAPHPQVATTLWLVPWTSDTSCCNVGSGSVGPAKCGGQSLMSEDLACTAPAVWSVPSGSLRTISEWHCQHPQLQTAALTVSGQAPSGPFFWQAEGGAGCIWRPNMSLKLNTCAMCRSCRQQQQLSGVVQPLLVCARCWSR